MSIDVDQLERPDVAGRMRTTLIVGLVGLAAWAVGGFSNPSAAFRAYLFGFVFWTGLGLGCMSLLMVQFLSGGAWGVMIRRILEAGSRTLVYWGLLIIPLLAGLPHIYEWAQADRVAVDPILQFKEPYLNIRFFMIRSVLYFAIWAALAFFLNKWSLAQDALKGRTEELDTLSTKLQRLSGGGLVVYVLTMTFASVDWVMSLDAHWFSTIFGLLFVASQALAAFAFVILLLSVLTKERPLSVVFRTPHFHDLGTFMFAFVMLWAYLSFSQFLITFSGNLPEEVPFYLHRTEGGWKAMILVIIMFHFVVPFFVLLMKPVKRNLRTLSIVAALLFFMRFVDLFWIMGPELHLDSPSFIHWLDLAAPIGLGGLWLALFFWQLTARPILPIGEPALQGALEHETH